MKHKTQNHRPSDIQKAYKMCLFYRRVYFNNAFHSNMRSIELQNLKILKDNFVYFKSVGPGKMIFISLFLKTKTMDLFSSKFCIFKSSLRTVSKHTHIPLS